MKDPDPERQARTMLKDMGRYEWQLENIYNTHYSEETKRKIYRAAEFRLRQLRAQGEEE